MNTQKIAIWVYEKGSCVGSFFPSQNSAAGFLGLQQSHVSEVLAGKRKSHKGYTFKPVYCEYEENRQHKMRSKFL